MKNIFIFLSIIIFTFSACRKDDHIIEVGPTTGNTLITEQSNLSGLVVDINGVAIEGAEIILQNKETTTDENGIYFFKDAEISSKGSLVKVKKPGFIPQFRFAFNEPGKLSFLNVVLIPEIEITKFSSTSGGTFSIQDKSKVKFYPNSILNQDGSLFSGEVTLNGYWYDPFNDKVFSYMPGDLRGKNKNGEVIQLATQGMFSLNIYDNQGNELIVGDPVELSFYVGNQGVDINGTGNMPLWYLNENTGEWIEEGNATLVDEYFVGEVSHFSFWNCDYPYPLSFISGIIEDENGTPIPNAEIKIIEQNLLSCGVGITNEVGYFEANVPSEADLTISLLGCEEEINIGPFIEGAHDVGSLTLNNKTINITGKLLDCNNQVVTEGYILIKNEITSKVFYGDENGNFTVTINNCLNTEWTVKAYDFSNSIYSDEIVLDPSNTFIDLGEINFCNNLDFYFAVSHGLDNELLIEPSADELQVLILDNNCLVISNHFENPIGNTYTLVYPLNDNLPVSILEQIKHTPTSQQFNSADNFTIELTELGYEVGDIIAGNYDLGLYKLDFRLQVTQKEESATIIIDSWRDENQNGIQDMNEGFQNRAEILINEVGNDSTYYESYYKIPYGMTFGSEVGKIQYTGLKGDREYTLTYLRDIWSGPQNVSPPNQGSDDNIDCDFIPYQYSNTAYVTDSFFVATGQIETSYDLGTYD